MAALPPPPLTRQASNTQELTAVFESLDADNDGALSVEEMTKAMTTLDIACDVTELFASVGVAPSDGIDYDAFVRLVESQGDVLHLAEAAPSLVDIAVRKFRHEVGRHVNLLKRPPQDAIGSAFRPASIVSTAERTVVFTGHQKADMDSIGAAVAASYLYSTSGCASLAAVTGTPEKKGDGRTTTNAESKFALLFWGDLLARDEELGSDVTSTWVPVDATQFYNSFVDERDQLHKGFSGFDVSHDVLLEPPTFATRAEAIEDSSQKLGVCLLDHNQKTQMPVSVDAAWSFSAASDEEKAAHVATVMSSVCGIIDHHALQSKTVETVRWDSRLPCLSAGPAWPLFPVPLP